MKASRIVLAAAVAMGLIGSVEAQERRIIGGGPSGQQLQLPELSAPDENVAPALDAWLTTLADNEIFSGVALLAQTGETVFSGAYGYADRAQQRRPELTTPFNIASIGKAFTQTAIGQLVDMGTLSLDDTIGKWLPDYPSEVTRAATIQQLLTHKGGIADFFGPAFDALPKSQFTSNADFYRFVSTQPPLFKPGEREQYCNGCYIVLGQIIAAASGLSYEDYIRRNIFAPAGMTGAAFTQPATAALPYGKPRPDMTSLEDVSTMQPKAGSAAGGWFATAADLLAFEQALRAGKFGITAQTLVLPDRPGAVAMIGGGSSGVNTLLMGNGEWTLVVLANFDPPIANAIGPEVFELVAIP